MRKKYPLVKISLRNGVLGGALGAVLLIALFYRGHHPLLIPVYLDFRIILFGVFLFITLKEFSDYYQPGFLYFYQGMLSGFLLTLVFSLICSILLYVYGEWNPEFVSSFIKQAKEQIVAHKEVLEEKGMYEQGLQSLSAIDNYFLASRFFWQSFIISFFVSIIISVILRRQPKP
jgi:Protein of unknown function (DUF4199)